MVEVLFMFMNYMFIVLLLLPKELLLFSFLLLISLLLLLVVMVGSTVLLQGRIGKLELKIRLYFFSLTLTVDF